MKTNNMKMKKFVFAVAAAMAVVACAKEETPEQKVNKGELSFSATMEQQQDAAKSALVDGTQVNWNVGDEVCVYHWDDGAVTYAGFTAETAGTATTFTDNPDHKQGLETLTDGDIAIYPFHEGNTLANTLTNDHTVTFTTSVDQTYVPNSFPAGANVAVGIVTTVNEKPVVNFRNVFGVLKLSLMGTEKVKSIKIVDNDNIDLTGKFAVDISNSDSPVFTQVEEGSKYILFNLGEEGVQLSSTPTDFYIVVPTGAFAHGFTATVTPLNGDYDPITIQTASANIINRSHIRAMPSRTLFFTSAYLLNGLFSVSATEKVRFSTGLLQAKYNASSSSYSFQIAESQLEYVGNAPGNSTLAEQTTDGALVDLFGWSTDNLNNPWGISYSSVINDYKGNFVDWSENSSFAGYNIPLQTPSYLWWEYLFAKRNCTFTIDGGESLNNRFAIVKINNTCGALMFPDTFNWSTSEMGNVPTTFNAAPEQAWNGTNYTLAQFAEMEKEGAVFLVAAGERFGKSVTSVNGAGRYWSSSVYYQTNANNIKIGATSMSWGLTQTNSFSAGQSVRLVSKVAF